MPMFMRSTSQHIVPASQSSMPLTAVHFSPGAQSCLYTSHSLVPPLSPLLVEHTVSQGPVVVVVV